MKPNTTPSRKVAFRAAKPGARLRASCAGSLRSDQSLSVTNEIPEFVFWALARISKPENVMTFATAGFFITPSVTFLVTACVRSSAAAAGRPTARRT